MSVSLTTLGPTADAIAHDVDHLHGEVTLVRRSADVVEVLSVVRSGLARAVLVAEKAHQCGPEFMDSLRQSQAVVAVVEGFDDDRLLELGAVLVPADAQPAEVAQILVTETQRIHHGVCSVDPADHVAESDLKSWDSFRELSVHLSDESAATNTEAIPGGNQAKIVVVWGPHGSPGRSTTAVNVAAEIAHAGHPVMLVDVDTWGPSVANMLGLLDEAAGVALACRAADRHRLDAEVVSQAAVRVDVGGAYLDVLTGLTRPERWPELRPASVTRMLQACRSVHRSQDSSRFPVVVVDVGFCLEEDEELTFDTHAPQRNAATLAALDVADMVLAVVSADAVGLPRAAAAVPLVMERTVAPVMVIANKVRKAAAGRVPRSGVQEAWDSMGVGVGISGYVCYDPAVLDQALLDGCVLSESAAKSTVRADFAAIAQQVVLSLSGKSLIEQNQESIRGTPLGRRMGAWLRR